MLGELAPSALPLYIEVARRELAIARRRGELSDEAAQAMRQLLDQRRSRLRETDAWNDRLWSGWTYSAASRPQRRASPASKPSRTARLGRPRGNAAYQASDWHVHPGHDTYGHVTRGRFFVEFGPNGSERVEIEPGDFVLIPKGRRPPRGERWRRAQRWSDCPCRGRARHRQSLRSRIRLRLTRPRSLAGRLARTPARVCCDRVIVGALRD